MARFNRVLEMFLILLPFVPVSVLKLEGMSFHVQFTFSYQEIDFPFPPCNDETFFTETEQAGLLGGAGTASQLSE